MTSPQTVPDRAAMPAAQRWAIVVLLALGMVIAYVDRANISVALAVKDFVNTFRLDDTGRGMLNSTFFWSYALLQIPAGMLVDRFGVKYPYAVAFVFWSVISALTGAASAVWQLITLRLLLGVGEALVTPSSLRWIRFNIPESSRGLATGIYMAGTKFGPAIGAPLAAMLIQSYGWRPMFIILGLGALAWLVPWMLFVRNDDRELEAQAARRAQLEPVPFRALFATPLLWGVILGTFCYNYFTYHSMTWLPAYFVERRGLSLGSMGWFTMFAFGGMATVAILAGTAADWMIRRGGNPVTVRKGFTIAGLLVASTEVAGAWTASNDVAVAFAVLSLAGLGLATANYWALTQTLMPGAAIGRIAGIQNCAANLSGIAAPLVTGWLKKTTGSYDAPLQAIWVLLLLGIGAYVFLVREKYIPGRGAR